MVKEHHITKPIDGEFISSLIKKKWRKAEWIDYLINLLLDENFEETPQEET